MITAGQMRAARALLGIDQRALAELSGLSLPTIQRMEASDGVVRGNVDSLMKLVGALQAAGIELIGEGAASTPGGRGVRLVTAAVGATRMIAARRSSSRPASRSASLGVVAARIPAGRVLVYGGSLPSAPRCWSPASPGFGATSSGRDPAARPALDRRAISGSTRWPRCFLSLIGLGGAGASLYALGYGRHEHEPRPRAAVLSRCSSPA